MKALIKQKPEVGIWMSEIDKPAIGPNEILVKIKKTAVCGTDIHIYKWNEWAQKTIPVPMTIGHEFVGEVAEIGTEVHGYKIGQRVSGEGHITCGICRNCRAGRLHLCRSTIGIGVNRPGAFAEYLSIPAANAYPIPDDISDDVAAILDPFGNATHAALSFPVAGEDVLITGAGPIGIIAVAIAKRVGAKHIVITDVNDYRLDLARKMGATRAVNINNTTLQEVMDDLKMTEGFDVAIEMSGHPDAMKMLVHYASHGARISLLGIIPNNTDIEWDQVIFKGLVMKGIYGREMFETWYKMIAMLQTGLDLTPVITHHFSADDYHEAFETLLSGQAGKVILEW